MASATQQPAAPFVVDEEVHLNPEHQGRYGGTWLVRSVPGGRQKNVVLDPKDGQNGGRGLRVPPQFLRHGPADPLSTQRGSAELIPFGPLEEVHEPGTVVRFKGVVYVVTEVRTGRRGSAGYAYKVFPLGGSDRYYTGVPASEFTVIPLDKIKIEEG